MYEQSVRQRMSAQTKLSNWAKVWKGKNGSKGKTKIFEKTKRRAKQWKLKKKAKWKEM